MTLATSQAWPPAEGLLGLQFGEQVVAHDLRRNGWVARLGATAAPDAGAGAWWQRTG